MGFHSFPLMANPLPLQSFPPGLHCQDHLELCSLHAHRFCWSVLGVLLYSVKLSIFTSWDMRRLSEVNPRLMVVSEVLHPGVSAHPSVAIVLLPFLLNTVLSSLLLPTFYFPLSFSPTVLSTLYSINLFLLFHYFILEIKNSLASQRNLPLK